MYLITNSVSTYQESVFAPVVAIVYQLRFRLSFPYFVAISFHDQHLSMQLFHYPKPSFASRGYTVTLSCRSGGFKVPAIYPRLSYLILLLSLSQRGCNIYFVLLILTV